MIRTTLGVLVSLSMATAMASEFDMQEWIDEQISSGAALAISAVVLKDGEADYFNGGVLEPGGTTAADEDTQYEIGSITKSFTNLLLAEMVKKGQVSFDTTISSILGDAVQLANPAIGDTTLLELATHTSGFPRLPADLAPTDPLDPYKGYDDAALLQSLTITRDKQPLGDYYAYSNLGVGVLGYLLGRVHGEGYVEAVLEYVVRPLGLERSGFDRDAKSATAYRNGEVVKDWSIDALAGAGSLRSTTGDLERLARIMLGEIDNPLAHDLDENLKIVHAADGFDVTRVWHVGESSDGKIYWHNGGTGGFWSFFGFKPATDEALGIIVSGDPEVTAIGLRGLGFESPQDRPGINDESIFGQYELAGGVGLGVYEINGVLVTRLAGQPPLPLYPISDDWYALTLADASLRFVREDGNVTATELVQNSIVQRATRIADTAVALAPPPDEIEVPHDGLTAFVGDYVINAAAKFTIKLEDDGLHAMLTGQPYFPIFFKGDDVFFYKIVDAELHFERGEDGSVNALVLHQGGIVQRAEKSN